MGAIPVSILGRPYARQEPYRSAVAPAPIRSIVSVPIG